MTERRRELREIVGEGHVWSDPQTWTLTRKTTVLPAENAPSGGEPKNVDQVQEIVKWANQTRTTLVPVSSGPPHFRGDTVPSAGGAVIVDLSRNEADSQD